MKGLENMDVFQCSKTAIDQVPAIIFLINVDHHGIMRFEKTNQFFEKATGLANALLNGKTPLEVFGEDIGRQMETVLHQCLETGESFKNELIMDLSDIKS